MVCLALIDFRMKPGGRVRTITTMIAAGGQGNKAHHRRLHRRHLCNNVAAARAVAKTPKKSVNKLLVSNERVCESSSVPSAHLMSANCLHAQEAREDLGKVIIVAICADLSRTLLY